MDREPWPTESEIEQAKEAIRRSWTDREERQRLGLSAVKFRVSSIEENVVSMSDVGPSAIRDEDAT